MKFAYLTSAVARKSTGGPRDVLIRKRLRPHQETCEEIEYAYRTRYHANWTRERYEIARSDAEKAALVSDKAEANASEAREKTVELKAEADDMYLELAKDEVRADAAEASAFRALEWTDDESESDEAAAQAPQARRKRKDGDGQAESDAAEKYSFEQQSQPF